MASRPAFGNAPDHLAVATGLVIASQLGFLLTAYLHCFLSGHLTPHKFHISAVLDDDDRSVLCAYVGLCGLASLVLLELCRSQPRRKLRASLAIACGGGIVLTCVVRESQYLNGHRGTAVLTFSAAVGLVCMISSLSRDPRNMRSATMLVALVVVTGCAQAANIISEENLGFEVLPSWALGTLELALILGFTFCICTISPCASSRCSSPTELAVHKGETGEAVPLPTKAALA